MSMFMHEYVDKIMRRLKDLSNQERFLRHVATSLQSLDDGAKQAFSDANGFKIVTDLQQIVTTASEEKQIPCHCGSLLESNLYKEQADLHTKGLLWAADMWYGCIEMVLCTLHETVLCRPAVLFWSGCLTKTTTSHSNLSQVNKTDDDQSTTSTQVWLHDVVYDSKPRIKMSHQQQREASELSTSSTHLQSS